MQSADQTPTSTTAITRNHRSKSTTAACRTTSPCCPPCSSSPPACGAGTPPCWGWGTTGPKGGTRGPPKRWGGGRTGCFLCDLLLQGTLCGLPVAPSNLLTNLLFNITTPKCRQIALSPALSHPGAATLVNLYAPKDAAVKKAAGPWGTDKVYPVTHWVVVDLATPR
jgi:hypothetical protein